MVEHNASFIPDLPRQVVPRWRLFGETLTRGELTPITTERERTFTQDDVAGQLRDWRDNPSLSVAADLVSVAFTLGLREVASDAAQYILERGRSIPAAQSIASLYLGSRELIIPQSTSLVTPVNDTSERWLITNQDRVHFMEIHNIRMKLGEYPRNPIAWCNLALHYSSLGQIPQAQRAIEIAIRLAPNNRFVLRSASRFFLHIGEQTMAHDLLTRSPLVRKDPWILSAEIATADALKKTSANMKQAKAFLDGSRFKDQQISELASAVGTIECKSGNSKIGRKRILVSLKDPTENAIAQAVWVSRNLHEAISVPMGDKSPEAAAWRATEAGEWQVSLDQAASWQDDQPFSSRPAIHGSFIASVAFEDFSNGQLLAETGLRRDSEDPLLLNNCAFAAAMNGDVELADRCLKQMQKIDLGLGSKIALLATSGLVAFRKGMPDLGRPLYKAAILLARSRNQSGSEALASSYYAMEELRCSSPDADRLCAEAVDVAERLNSPLGRLLAKTIKHHQQRSTRSSAKE